MKTFALLLLGSLFVFSSPTFAETLSPQELKGLEETKKVLSDPQLLLEAATKNAGGTEALKELEKVAGSPENQKLILALASDIMDALLKEAKGDPEKLMVLLSDLQRNPANLEKKLTKAQRERLSAIGKKIEAKGKLP